MTAAVHSKYITIDGQAAGKAQSARVFCPNPSLSTKSRDYNRRGRNHLRTLDFALDKTLLLKTKTKWVSFNMT